MWGQFNAKRIFNLLSKMRMAIAYPSQPVSLDSNAYLLDLSQVWNLVILLVMDLLRLVGFIFTRVKSESSWSKRKINKYINNTNQYWK